MPQDLESLNVRYMFDLINLDDGRPVHMYDECQYSSGATTCTCNSDYCNSSPKMNGFGWTSLCVLIGAILIKL